MSFVDESTPEQARSVLRLLVEGGPGSGPHKGLNSPSRVGAAIKRLPREDEKGGRGAARAYDRLIKSPGGRRMLAGMRARFKSNMKKPS